MKYLLSAIDMLSKVGYLVPLKTKQSSEVARAVAHIFKDQTPVQVCMDRGSEFKSKEIQLVQKDRGIHHLYAGGSTKAVTVEHLHRSLRAHIATYEYRENMARYIYVLQSLVGEGCNKSYHRKTKMVPIDVTKDHDDLAYANIRREFFQQWSEEIFALHKGWCQPGICMYCLQGCTWQTLEESFYSEELAKVEGNPRDTFRIEKYLDEKTENWVKYIKVMWKGY